MVAGGRRIMKFLKKEEDEEEMGVAEGNGDLILTGSYHHPVRLRVGYALTMKKKWSFLKPEFEDVARTKGILLIAIDPKRSLSEQGPFDVLLQKLSGKEWRQILEDYRLIHPEVTILDSPTATQLLQNRQSMLQDVADLNLSNNYGSVGVPRQVVIKEDTSSIPDAVAKAGLSFPIVAKPLYSDGSAKSHELWLAYDLYSLEILEPPLVLQEFVNHGGILFKVFIIGETIKVVRRYSLPDVNEHNLLEKAGAFRYPRVSCAAASADNADLPHSIAELPPWPLLEELARELRQRMCLQLFNLDIIRERGSYNRYYVIDINYFPGYSKMPDYENVFTDFLLTFVENKGLFHPVEVVLRRRGYEGRRVWL